jgi:hypothetical protein
MLAFAMRAKVARKLFLPAAVAAAVLLWAAAPALAGPFPRPNQAFPGIGADTLGPEFLIVINPNGSASLLPGPGAAQGEYDGSGVPNSGDDTYWGVVNNSGQAVSSLKLTSASSNFAFDFEGDGIANGFSFIGGGLSGPVPGNSSDTLSGGYGGPNAFFTDRVFGNPVGFDSAVVNFVTPIPPGFQDIFSLEGNANLSSVQVNSVAPEPGTLALLGIGLGGLLVYRRRRGKA